MQNTTLKMWQYISDKFYLVLFQLLVVLFVLAMFLNMSNPADLWPWYVFGPVFFIYQMVVSVIILRQKPSGEFCMVRQKPPFNYAVVCMLCLYLFRWVSLSFERERSLGIFITFSCIALAECAAFILFRFYKIISVVITANHLVVFDRLVTKRRNLECLTSIEVSSLETHVIFVFSKLWTIRLGINEYSPQDLQTLVSTAIAASKHQVRVHPKVYRLLQPRTPKPRLPFFKRLGKGVKDTLLP